MRQVTVDGSRKVSLRALFAPVVREASRWAGSADLDDVRRYDFTQGWDREDAELGWVDADVVATPRRLH